MPFKAIPDIKLCLTSPLSIDNHIRMDRKVINDAVVMLKHLLIERLGTGIELFIFGSVARGDYSNDSDIDVLIVFDGTVTNTLEENIFDIAYDVSLEHGVVFGVIVYPRDLWYSPRGSGMPLYESVSKDGYRI